jgi:hypothetical protein
MNKKLYLSFAIIALTGLFSLSFTSNKVDSLDKKMNYYPAGGCVGYGAGLTGASWDNSGRTCNSCHSGGSYNPTTQITLLNGSTPVTQYVPGTAYTVQVKITSASGAPKYSFAVMCATTSAHTNINKWGTMPTGVANHTVSARNYVEQTSARTATSTSPTSNYILSIPWTAPLAGTGSVTFYAEGMAVNGTGNTAGDSPGAGVNASFTENTTLPVVFSSISAVRNKNGVTVNWTSETEINTQSYSVENSIDGSNFKIVGTKNASNISGRAIYNYTHTNPTKGINFYRVVANDFNGVKTYSKTVKVSIDNNDKITVNPNIVSENLNLQGLDLVGCEFKILNLNGDKIKAGKFFQNTINVAALPTGTYFISVIFKDGTTQTMKFIKM